MTFDTSLRHMVQAIVTVLAVINPVVCGAIFLTLTPNLALPQRWLAAVKVAISILAILVGSGPASGKIDLCTNDRNRAILAAGCGSGKEERPCSSVQPPRARGRSF